MFKYLISLALKSGRFCHCYIDFTKNCTLFLLMVKCKNVQIYSEMKRYMVIQKQTEKHLSLINE